MPPRLIRLEIVTPEGLNFSGEIEQLEAAAIDGEIGILPGHAPLITGLKTGVLRITRGGELYRVAASEGFMEVGPDRINVLVRTAEKQENIDTARAREARARAEERLKSRESSIDYARAEAALQRAIARLKAAGED